MLKKYLYSAIFLVSALIFAVVPVFVPSLFFLTAVPAVLCYAFSVIMAHSVAIPGAVVALLAVFLITGSPSLAFFFLMLFFPVGIALGMAFRLKKNLNGTASGVTLSSMAFGLATLFVLIFELGNGEFDPKAAFSPVYDGVITALESVFLNESLGLSGVFAQYGIPVEQISEIILSSFVYSIPTLYMCFMLLCGVLCFWIIKFIMKRTSEPVSFMGRFDDCRVGYAGAILYFIASLVTLFSSNTLVSLVFSNFSNVMSYVFAYAGISLVAYLLDFKNITGFIKVAVITVLVAICLFPSGFLNFVALVGVIDTYWNVRERLSNKGI